jgi:hypothetical protein
MQARIEEFHRNIGKALCDNLNRAVLAKPQRNLQLIANNQEQGPQEHRTFEAMIEQLDRELEESVPAQFNQTEESFFAPKLKIVRSD